MRLQLPSCSRRWRQLTRPPATIFQQRPALSPPPKRPHHLPRPTFPPFVTLLAIPDTTLTTSRAPPYHTAPVLTPPPLPLFAPPAAAAAATGAADGAAAPGADGKVTAAAPGDGARAAGVGADGLAGAGEGATGAGGERLSRKAKIAREKAVAAIKARRKELEESRIDPQVHVGWCTLVVEAVCWFVVDRLGDRIPSRCRTTKQMYHPSHSAILLYTSSCRNSPARPSPAIPPASPLYSAPPSPPRFQIPLLPFSGNVRQAFEDTEARADAGPSDPPYCCFFTLDPTPHPLPHP